MPPTRKNTNLEHKFTTTGVSYAQLIREEHARNEKDKKMIEEIETTVRYLQWKNTLRERVFHFIHVNYYCRVENGGFVPCEIGIAKFTFQYGATDSYHSIINQESIPLGYKFESGKISSETHTIPLPPHDLGERDYNKLFVEIKSFLMDSVEPFPPPLYTVDTNAEAAKFTLSAIAGDDELFRVYPLTKLLFELRNACAQGVNSVGFPVQSLADRELEKDFFNFAPGISCDYHENTDACQYCSLSVVKRWCFLFASVGCPDLGIELRPGCHRPRDIRRNVPQVASGRQTERNQEAGSQRRNNDSSQNVPIEPPPITIIDHSKDSEPCSQWIGGKMAEIPIESVAGSGSAQRTSDNQDHSSVSVHTAKSEDLPNLFSTEEPEMENEIGATSLNFYDRDIQSDTKSTKGHGNSPTPLWHSGSGDTTTTTTTNNIPYKSSRLQNDSSSGHAGRGRGFTCSQSHEPQISTPGRPAGMHSLRRPGANNQAWKRSSPEVATSVRSREEMWPDNQESLTPPPPPPASWMPTTTTVTPPYTTEATYQATGAASGYTMTPMYPSGPLYRSTRVSTLGYPAMPMGAASSTGYSVHTVSPPVQPPAPAASCKTGSLQLPSVLGMGRGRGVRSLNQLVSQQATETGASVGSQTMQGVANSERTIPAGRGRGRGLSTCLKGFD